MKALISRALRGKKPLDGRGERVQRGDVRGEVRENSCQAQTRLTPSEVAELVAEYEAGMPVKALAARFGVHRITVSEIVRREGATPRWTASTPAQRKHAAALYGQGYSLSQTAKRVGVSTSTVRAAVVAEGGTLRPKGYVTRMAE